MVVGSLHAPLLNIQLQTILSCRNYHPQLISLQWLSEWLQLLWPYRATTLGATRKPYKVGKRSTKQPGSHGRRAFMRLHSYSWLFGFHTVVF